MKTKFFFIGICLFLMQTQVQAQVEVLYSQRMKAVTATTLFGEIKTIEGSKDLIATSGTQESFIDFIYQRTTKGMELIVDDLTINLTQYMDDGGNIRKIEIRAQFGGKSEKLKGECKVRLLTTYYYTPENELHFMDIITHVVAPDMEDEDNGYIVYDIKDGTVLREVLNDTRKDISDTRKVELEAYHKSAKKFRLLE